MAGGGGGVGGGRCGFVLIVGLDEGGCDDVLDEDGESIPCTERIEDEEGVAVGKGEAVEGVVAFGTVLSADMVGNSCP